MKDWRHLLAAMIVQDEVRAAFDSLTTKNHVTYALIHHGDKHNDLPSLLATIVKLGGSREQLHAAYESRRPQIEPWPMSPARLSSAEERLGDTRFQRAYVDFFSLEMTKFNGNARGTTLSYLVSGPKPLLYGLFGGFGQPLLSLADAFELSTPLLFVQSLVLASIDWSDSLYALLTDPIFETDATDEHKYLPPMAALSRTATDGRLADVMRGAIGYHSVQLVLANPISRAAVLEYVVSVDLSNITKLLEQLAELSVLLLCGTHRPGKPAFDFYFSQLPAFVQAVGVLLPEMEGEAERRLLLRGVWMLFVLAYITQLRPILDDRLFATFKMPGDANWLDLFSNFHGQSETLQGNYLDSQFLRALKSIWELAQRSPEREELFLRAAYKLRDEWQCWTGLGNDGAGSLNIRL